jgi:hypothetical protein
MLNAPVTSVPRTATYKINYENNNLINKPTIPTLPPETTDAQILPYVVLGASAALDNPNINLLFVRTLLKLIYPSPLILSVLNVPLPPQALLLLS